MKGICVVCGNPIPANPKTKEGHCMHIRHLEIMPVQWMLHKLFKFHIITKMEVCPSQFDQVTVYSGLWLCHACNSRIAENAAKNAANFNNGFDD